MATYLGEVKDGVSCERCNQPITPGQVVVFAEVGIVEVFEETELVIGVSNNTQTFALTHKECPK